MFTTLNVEDMLSIVVAAPPNTAVFHAVNGGWTLTDHLLATGYEHQTGLVGGPATRIERPGVTDIRPSTVPRIDHNKPVQKLGLDVMSIQEFEARLRAHTEGV